MSKAMKRDVIPASREAAKEESALVCAKTKRRREFGGVQHPYGNA
jgi:hypothetical protein